MFDFRVKHEWTGEVAPTVWNEICMGANFHVIDATQHQPTSFLRGTNTYAVYRQFSSLAFFPSEQILSKCRAKYEVLYLVTEFSSLNWAFCMKVLRNIIKFEWSNTILIVSIDLIVKHEWMSEMAPAFWSEVGSGTAFHAIDTTQRPLTRFLREANTRDMRRHSPSFRQSSSLSLSHLAREHAFDHRTEAYFECNRLSK